VKVIKVAGLCFLQVLCLWVWFGWSSPLLVRWLGVEVPLSKSQVRKYRYQTKQFTEAIGYQARIFYNWNGKSYQRKFNIDEGRFWRLKQGEKLKVAFLPSDPTWHPLLEGNFALWSDRAILPFLGFLLNVGFWGTILESHWKKNRSKSLENRNAHNR
jgi:hypothetical protein